MPVLPRLKTYDDVYAQFRWQVPARYNIGVDICDRWAAREPDRLAILHVRADGREDRITYGWLRETSNRLANALRSAGLGKGDRVATLLFNSAPMLEAHFGVPAAGGVLSTAGKLVFAGDVSGNLVAYDAANGKPLWHAYLGTTVSNAPETYMLDGHQYVLVAAGDTLYSFVLN